MNAPKPEALGKCDHCAKRAAVLLAYGPHRLCAGHFNRFFERRVYRTIRKFGLIKPKERIAIGVSGGKDSMATAKILAERFGKSNEMTAICIDEGIQGYREKALKKAEKFLAELNVPVQKVEFREVYGKRLDEIMKTVSSRGLGTSCSFCGVFRRGILNKVALELKADKLATGHNLDDECQSIAMNVFMNDLGRAKSLGPIVKSNNAGLVPRIKPLYESPENEVIAYAALNGIDSYDGECCPYSSEAKRNFFREMINKAEESFPGTKFAMLRHYLALKPYIEKAAKGKMREFGECGCGNPTSGGNKCNACMQLEKLSSEAKPKKAKARKSGLTCAQTKGLGKRN